MDNKKIAISGASGLIGRAISARLTQDNYKILSLVRQSAGAASDRIYWDYQKQQIESSKLEDLEAVVHLAGESIMGLRWTKAKKQRIRQSRVEGTRFLCENLACLKQPPKVLLCASAIGFYGDRGAEFLTEDSPVGKSFLAQVVQDWEAACEPAHEAGIRVVNLRLGVVLSAEGGALSSMLPVFRLGLGGVVGDGSQYMSWIAIQDVASIAAFVLGETSCSGPINVVSPLAATNREFTKILGKVLRRPTIFPLPKFAARLLMGQMADELLLASANVAPKKLLDLGYKFEQSELESALRQNCLSKPEILA